MGKFNLPLGLILVTSHAKLFLLFHLISYHLFLWHADDCAAIILTCLFCQLSDFFHILPEVFNRALDRCFPSCKYLCALSEPNCDLDCCNCTLDLDCGLLGSCHEATELLELALEISEVCHRWALRSCIGAGEWCMCRAAVRLRQTGGFVTRWTISTRPVLVRLMRRRKKVLTADTAKCMNAWKWTPICS